jgi:hypothetical protein
MAGEKKSPSEMVRKLPDAFRRLTEFDTTYDQKVSVDYNDYKKSKVAIAAKEFREKKLQQIETLGLSDASKADLKAAVERACNAMDTKLQQSVNEWHAGTWNKNAWDTIFSEAKTAMTIPGANRAPGDEAKLTQFVADQKDFDEVKNSGVAEIERLHRSTDEQLSRAHIAERGYQAVSASNPGNLEKQLKSIFKPVGDVVLEEAGVVQEREPCVLMTKITRLQNSKAGFYRSDDYGQTTYERDAKANAFKISAFDNLSFIDSVTGLFDESIRRAAVHRAFRGLFKLATQLVGLKPGDEVILGNYDEPARALSNLNGLKNLLIMMQVAKSENYIAELDPATRAYLRSQANNDKTISLIPLVKISEIIKEIFEVEESMKRSLAERKRDNPPVPDQNTLRQQAVDETKTMDDRKGDRDTMVTGLGEAKVAAEARLHRNLDDAAVLNEAEARKHAFFDLTERATFGAAGTPDIQKLTMLEGLARTLSQRQLEARGRYELAVRQLSQLPRSNADAGFITEQKAALQRVVALNGEEIADLEKRSKICLQAAQALPVFGDRAQDTRKAHLIADVQRTISAVETTKTLSAGQAIPAGIEALDRHVQGLDAQQQQGQAPAPR